MNNFIIRNAKSEDLNKVAEIEEKTFPVEEKASIETIYERMTAFPNCFFVGEIEGKIIGFTNGCSTNRTTITDELFHNIANEDKNGEIIAVFSLSVDPEYQRQGIAEQLLNHLIENARKEGRKKVILTCKEHLIHYYERFGFVNTGISESQHGGAKWYDMILQL